MFGAIQWADLLAPAMAAAIAGVFLLISNYMTARETRRRSTDQHVEQTTMLTTLVQNQHTIKQTLDTHREEVAREVSELKGQVGGVIETQGMLFNMIADVDQKVSKKTNSKKPNTLIGVEVHE